MEFTVNINDEMQKKLASFSAEINKPLEEITLEAIEYYLSEQEYIHDIRCALIAGEESGRSDYSLENLMQKLGRK